MIKRFKSILFASAFLLAFAFIFSSSCKRNKECDAVINVVDEASGAPVSGATVHIFPNQTSPQGSLSSQDQSGTTDGSGSVSFHFKVPAILQADVAAGSGKKGTELVKLEEGKQVTKTIKIR